MSGLAAMLASGGARVSGEDASGGMVVDRLREAGVDVAVGEPDARSPGCPRGVEFVIASAAIPAGHRTLREAAARMIPVLTYAEALGLVQCERTGISIAGTHGKSTTTSLLGHLLIEVGLDPGVIVGARCASLCDPRDPIAAAVGGSRVGARTIPSGALAGRPGLLVAEACEYRRSFLEHRPRFALVNNLEADHLDVYRDLAEIIEAFRDFARLLPSAAEGGKLLIAHEGAHREEVAAGVVAAVETFGWHPLADWVVGVEPGGRTTLTPKSPDRPRLSWRTPLPGRHSSLNSAAAAILAWWSGADPRLIPAAIESFGGLDRRMQVLGRRRVSGGEVTVVDDYGHHPTECAATLVALREFHRPRRLVCVFQPHQHSRTRHLLDDFARSFSAADLVLVPEIHFARDSEADRRAVSSADLVARLRAAGTDAMHLPRAEDVLRHLEANARPGDLVVTMGAGPMDALALAYLAAPARRTDVA